MAFTLVRPTALLRYEDWSKTASTAYAIGVLVQPDLDNSGIGYDKCVAASTAILGNVQQTIASTDSDYASTTRTSLLVDEFGEWEVDVGAGTPTANYEGLACDLYSTTALSVDVTATTTKLFLIKNFISATKVRGKIVKWASMGYAAVS